MINIREKLNNLTEIYYKKKISTIVKPIYSTAIDYVNPGSSENRWYPYD